jgi:hypothetical protein
MGSVQVGNVQWGERTYQGPIQIGDVVLDDAVRQR